MTVTYPDAVAVVFSAEGSFLAVKDANGRDRLPFSVVPEGARSQLEQLVKAVLGDVPLDYYEVVREKQKANPEVDERVYAFGYRGDSRSDEGHYSWLPLNAVGDSLPERDREAVKLAVNALV